MNPTSALGDFQQTALILIPEFILLFVAMGIMTASAFIEPAAPLLVRAQGRRPWSRRSVALFCPAGQARPGSTRLSP